MKFLGNSIIFVIIYIVFMAFTYFLPYLGSNSGALMGLGQIASETSGGQVSAIYPLFWVHFGCFVVLIVITLFRGIYIDKKWLVIFPILAGVFDLVPGLSLIPLVPTVMHLLAIILGVARVKQKIV